MVVRLHGAREDDISNARDRLGVAAHPRHRFKGLAANEEGVEPGTHGREVDLRIDHDPVILSVGSGNVSVQAHRATVNDSPHGPPPYLNGRLDDILNGRLGLCQATYEPPMMPRRR